MITIRRRSALRALVAASGALVCLAWPRPSSVEAVAAEAVPQAREGVLWLAPSVEEVAARGALSRAVADLANGRAAAALPVFERAAPDRVLGSYAMLFAGRARLALKQPADAATLARQVLAASPTGHLAEAAQLLLADAVETVGDWNASVGVLRGLAASRPVAAHWLRLARAAENAGEITVAVEAYGRVHYDHVLAPEASEATASRARLAPSLAVVTKDSLAADLARAERLYNARRYADARKAFEALRPAAAGEERRLADLRLAQCDFYLKRHTAARDALRGYLDRSPASRVAEAEYFYLSAVREIGRHDEYVDRVRSFVDRYGDSALAEAALNELGTHYILANDDGKAAEVFADLYRRYPTGAFADRAAWKAGWWAYKSGDHAEAIRIFESAASGLRRADYRPSWLYWSARAHRQLGHRDEALAGYRQVIADYRNSYYGREAAAATEEILAALRPAGAGPVSPASRELPPTIVPDAPPANAPLVRALLAAGMFDEAIAELRSISRETRTSPLIEATVAYALHRKGELRLAITAMRRAYPQFMAEGGEALPAEILMVIFPVDHWALIRQHAAARRLDPFLVTALIAQESTFQADVRSVANAWGLMQVVPATGRRYALNLGIRPFGTTRLTEPEVNIRIGTAYFADLVRQFGDIAPALAAYNAGESRVSRWVAERPGIDRDEFIDDIPFPETQNYVKRVIGTAEDYRQLYRGRQ